jgi:transposase
MIVMGVDVSKSTLDAALFFPSNERMRGHHKVGNDQAGIAELAAWSIHHAGGVPSDVRVIVEATSTYHELVTELFYAKGLVVVVANAKRVKKFRESESLNKTDPGDAKMLALFGAAPRRKRHPWQPPPDRIASLRLQLRRLATINRDTHRELSRFKALRLDHTPQSVLDSFQRVRLVHQKERRHLLADIRARLKADAWLNSQHMLMRTMPAVGEICASHLLCVMRSRPFRNARQVAALLGLTPVQTQSGVSVSAPGHLSGEGDRAVRSALYMAAMCAIRMNKKTGKYCNPALRAIYDRMRKADLRPKQSLVVLMRHIVQSEYGMLYHGRPFDSRLVSGVTREQRDEILGPQGVSTRRGLPAIDSPPIAALAAP